MNSWLAALLDLLFPPHCPACSAPMPSWGEWCPDCLKSYQLELILPAEAQELLYLDYITVLSDYRGAVRRLLQNIKFHHQHSAAAYLHRLLPPLTDLVLPEIPGSSLADWATAVVPVPVHAARRQERGYNQTDLIFHDWAVRQGVVWLDVLQRIKPTVPQYSLNPAERRANIKGAFVVTRPEVLTNQHILLVDDIYTSGITLDECAHVLRSAGAAGIYGLVLASSAR